MIDKTDFQYCTCTMLRRASRHITRLYDEKLSKVPIKATQLPILVALDRMNGIPLTIIAEHLKMDRTTLTRNLAPLERDGLVKTTLNDLDRREKKLHLTTEGRARLKRANSIWLEVQEATIKKIGGKRLKDLIEIMQKLESID